MDNNEEEIEELESPEEYESQQVDDNEDYIDSNTLKEGFGRDEFAKRVKNNNYYKEEAAKLENKQREAKDATAKAREEKNKDWKYNNDEDKKNSAPVNSDGSNTENKNFKDKFNDNKNLAQSKLDEASSKLGGINNKVNDLKSKAYMAQNPLEAAKAMGKEKAKTIAKEKAALAAKQVAAKVGTKIAAVIASNPYVLAIIAAIFLLFLIIFVVVLNVKDESEIAGYYGTGVGYWWPIGSAEIEEIDGKLFTLGEPMESVVTSEFGYRCLDVDNDGVDTCKNHSGVDIDITGDVSEIPIIAVKGGSATVVNNNCEVGDSKCGAGYGNYVIIDHGDNIKTLYAHLEKALVEASDQIDQGQVIGYMGTTGSSTGVHLHFEFRINNEKVNPLDYISLDTPRISSDYDYVLGLKLNNTNLSKSQFVTKLQSYCTRTNNSKCINNFANNADMIYDVSKDVGVNPELVVAYAKIEYGFSCYNGNCWGIGHGNTESSGNSYSSLKDGIKAFANTILKYNNTSSSFYGQIESMKEAAIKEGCVSGPYILPNTLVWVQSKYSSIGSYLYNPGSSGRGGCYYIDYWAKNGFAGYTTEYYNSRCGSSNKCSSGSESSCSSYKPTTCEINDYSLYNAVTRADIVMSIFYN